MLWRIPVTWEMCGVVEVEDDTLKNAMMIARDDEGVFLLADDKEYVDGSWRVLQHGRRWDCPQNMESEQKE